mmetsp:Transcript_63252/g.140982  ORF Transcript_63252/g.140982 Transcript_63252/m.140982 type:complete len:160 (+) Transcript_63252:1466-1945(+)|eukprot:CAMPEP_0181189354 /NCGR_PEP_ID=MMETSP1096-20121128/11615_1 /TAXON_ID=156174 ORGANISM="Chrysochromulina ericina, Strain CCMP281" /NCGR_SAMPLE_ID=MMETSP1096 /ASSEMBLY_ACC=CAM_ASM_000453 /LENGTH=159 /DNA_ID=CAMNT_0023278497 /DNA_START=1240 /DNA_END=1719 /DNA_ORIENTATION=+
MQLFFALMVVSKGFSYALNSPAREMLYAVTSEQIKFKAKSWIDVFGGHSAKAAGSAVNHSLKHSLDALMSYGSAVTLFLSLLFAWTSAWLGVSFERHLAEGQLVGEDCVHELKAGLVGFQEHSDNNSDHCSPLAPRGELATESMAPAARPAVQIPIHRP